MPATSSRDQSWRGTGKAAVRVAAGVDSPMMGPGLTWACADGGMVSSLGKRVPRGSWSPSPIEYSDRRQADNAGEISQTGRTYEACNRAGAARIRRWAV